jgi:iron(III) transport system substrate-binding protein
MKEIGNGIKPIHVEPALAEYLDQGKRLAFLKQWKDVVGKK